MQQQYYNDNAGAPRDPLRRHWKKESIRADLGNDVSGCDIYNTLKRLRASLCISEIF